MLRAIAAAAFLLVVTPTLACEPAPGAIKSSGHYCIKADTTETFEIAASNVTLDLLGNCINGPTDALVRSTAIRITHSASNITIRGGCIRGHMRGIATEAPVDGFVVSDMNIHEATFRGIHAEGRRLDILRNLIEDIGGSAIFPDAYAMGIELRPSGGDCDVADNVVRDVMPTEGGSGEGVAVLIEDDCRISGNTLVNSKMPTTGRTFALWSGGAAKPDVRGNIAVGFTYGFEAPGASGNIAIDMACVSYSNLQSEDAYLRRQSKPPLCPDDLRAAVFAAKLADRNTLFRIGQIHARANQTVLALSYFMLARDAGSGEAARLCELMIKMLAPEDIKLARDVAESNRRTLSTRAP